MNLVTNGVPSARQTRLHQTSCHQHLYKSKQRYANPRSAAGRHTEQYWFMLTKQSVRQ